LCLFHSPLLRSLLLYALRNEFDTDKICGYGTARCRRRCKTGEFFIGTCPNIYPCCLKTWDKGESKVG
uniref:Beta-defensin n=1 Tax=Panthera leo TaxID=9689 RepID=A0A8C8X6Y5_PANLE